MVNFYCSAKYADMAFKHGTVRFDHVRPAGGRFDCLSLIEAIMPADRNPRGEKAPEIEMARPGPGQAMF